MPAKLLKGEELLGKIIQACRGRWAGATARISFDELIRWADKNGFTTTRSDVQEMCARFGWQCVAYHGDVIHLRVKSLKRALKDAIEMRTSYEHLLASREGHVTDAQEFDVTFTVRFRMKSSMSESLVCAYGLADKHLAPIAADPAIEFSSASAAVFCQRGERTLLVGATEYTGELREKEDVEMCG